MPVSDEEIIEVVSSLEKVLDTAFVNRDYGTVKKLIAPDYVAITPAYGHPIHREEQLELLCEMRLKICASRNPKLSVLGPCAVLLQQEKSYSGSFNGKPLPQRVFATAIWSKSSGQWRERLYQETAIGSD